MKIAVLGATGSIGTQTLDAVRSCLPNAEVVALSGYSNMETLARLVSEFRPWVVWVPNVEAAKHLRQLSRFAAAVGGCEILVGRSDLNACASQTGADVVVNALVGRAGLAPTLAAIQAGKNIALANKETLVTAGELVMSYARKHNVSITPIDSEHSAIWQCITSAPISSVEKIILTASGGPFRTWSRKRIAAATSEEALRHPNWDMGAKITVDSATLMNKGLELIEAMHLFAQPLSKIEILVHPQSVIHSMVQFHDGGVMAQLGLPDMRLPILYALCGPKRVKTDFPRMDFLKHRELTFEEPNIENFPCLALAKCAAETGGTLPAVMNYINEWAVQQFLQNRIGFYEISEIIDKAFSIYNVEKVTSLASITEAEAWAAKFVKRILL